MEDLQGRRLGGRYILEHRIESGGMATVWRGRDEVLGRSVAVKILRDELAHDPDLRERFRMEAVAAARLSHPALVRVFDTGAEDGVSYIVMELFDGRSLASVAEEGNVMPEEAARIVADALRGLSHAHGAGVVHRDVKPGNILIDRSGAVKVADFGIAKAAFGHDLTTTGNLLGTARYLAPEQVSGGPTDERSDIYAAGVVLYELLAGLPPFQGESHIATATMRLTNDPPSPSSLRPGIPPALEAVAMRALARNPAERFQTAEEMAAALDRAVSTEPAVSPPPPSKRASRPLASRSWALAPVVLAVVAAGAVGSFVAFRALLDGGESSARGEQAGRPVEIREAYAFDPFGTGGENDEDAPAAIDRDDRTAWETEGYVNQDMDKPGVGIGLELGPTPRLSGLRLRTTVPGWTFELRESPNRRTLGQPLTSTDGRTSFRAERAVTVPLDRPASRYLVVWITNLPDEPGEEDGKYRASVAEVRVFGA